jgi:hypothetical protein
MGNGEKMSTEFDPNATPECDAKMMRSYDAGDVVALNFAEELEMERNELKEKLRIAVEALNAAHKSFGQLMSDSDEDIEQALREIEQVGKQW